MLKLSNFIPIILIFTLMGLSGCASTPKSSVADQRQNVLSMKDQVLSELFTLKPDVQAQINSVPGYAVFSNKNVNLILASFSGGYGVLKNNLTGQHTFMNMGEVGLGIGLGLKDFRVIFVFHTQDAMQRFSEQGWSIGAHGDAIAKIGDQGKAFSQAAIIDSVTIYQITEKGLALQANIKGTKYWKSRTLN